MLGTKALQVFDETTSVVRTTLRWVEFYKHESCGKCTPCREGNWWLVQMLKKFEAGHAVDGDVEKLLDICDDIGGKSFCALADGAVACVTSAVRHFRAEFEAGYTHARPGSCSPTAAVRCSPWPTERRRPRHEPSRHEGGARMSVVARP